MDFGVEQGAVVNTRGYQIGQVSVSTCSIGMPLSTAMNRFLLACSTARIRFTKASAARQRGGNDDNRNYL